MSTKKILYVDMDDVLCNYQSAYSFYKSENPKLKFPQSLTGFFEDLKPIERAVDSVNELRSRSELDVYILTAPSTRNIHSYSEKRFWVEKHFDYEFTEKLIICSNKGLLKGSYLIDDNVDGKGQESFEGELIHYGSEQYPDWETVVTYLMAQV